MIKVKQKANQNKLHEKKKILEAIFVLAESWCCACGRLRRLKINFDLSIFRLLNFIVSRFDRFDWNVIRIIYQIDQFIINLSFRELKFHCKFRAKLIRAQCASHTRRTNERERNNFTATTNSVRSKGANDRNSNKFQIDLYAHVMSNVNTNFLFTIFSSISFFFPTFHFVAINLNAIRVKMTNKKISRKKSAKSKTIIEIYVSVCSHISRPRHTTENAVQTPLSQTAPSQLIISHYFFFSFSFFLSLRLSFRFSSTVVQLTVWK